MNIKFEIKGKTDVKNLYVRMYQGKFDISAPIGLLVLESDWDAENNSFYLANPLNLKLQELKVAILRAYNQSFSQGELITSLWLKQVVKEEFNRPINEISLINDSKDVYLTDFGDWWNDNKADLWKVGPKKLLSKVQKSQYKKIISQLKDFEKSVGFKLVLKDITLDNLYEVVNYFEENDYNSSTISRNIDRIRFFMNRASEEGLKVSNVRSQRVYIDKEDDEIESVYLSEEELSLIHNHTNWKSELFSEEDLEHAKDNLILSCYTSLRISDFMNGLDISKIKENKILIRTKKTKQFTIIPLHNFVKEILNKRFGNIPKKFNNHTYNLMIKECCRIVKIENQVFGKLWDKKLKRKTKGYRSKWKYISSHCGRKSFISNLKGKISDEALMSIGAWKSTEMMNFYNKTSKTEYANELHDFWQNQNN